MTALYLYYALLFNSEATVQEHIHKTDPVEAIHALREEKNHFKPKM